MPTIRTRRQAGQLPACPQKEKPARSIAIHEAGHALAHWWNGQYIDCVVARTKTQIGSGPYIDDRGRTDYTCAGTVEANNFISSPLMALEFGHSMESELLEDFVARDLLHTLSGPVADSMYRHRHLHITLLGGGYYDWQAASTLLALLPDDQRDIAERQAIARSRELVRRYWHAVEALADLLQEHGFVEGEDATALLCAVTGETPVFRRNAVADLDRRGARNG